MQYPPYSTFIPGLWTPTTNTARHCYSSQPHRKQIQSIHYQKQPPHSRGFSTVHKKKTRVATVSCTLRQTRPIFFTAMFSSIKLNKIYSSEGTGPESLESDPTKLYFIDISRITPPKRKPFARTVRSPHLPCSDSAFEVLTTHQKTNQQLFILGFFLPPVIPWLVCIAITIGKYKSTVKVTKDDQYWAFLCLFALAVYLLLAVAILMCLAVEFRWFGKIAA